jgi:hypothetical protein
MKPCRVLLGLAGKAWNFFWDASETVGVVAVETGNACHACKAFRPPVVNNQRVSEEGCFTATEEKPSLSSTH